MNSITRRRLLGAAALAPLLPAAAFAQSAPMTPSCGKQTARQTAGPFFKPSSPKRISLLEENPKDRLVLQGVVLSPECKPVANALLDFWHADDFGEYDNQGFRYRGHQFTDAQGRYRLETILPGEYPGRTRHFHVNVQAPGRRMLTTQLYIPGDAGNRRDALYRPELVISMPKPGAASFDFVVDA